MNLPTLPSNSEPAVTTLALLAVGWCVWNIKTEPTVFNLYVYGGLALFVFLPITAIAIRQWLQREKNQREIDALREQHRIEDREEARAEKARDREETRRLRNRGLAERIRDFIFGRDD